MDSEDSINPADAAVVAQHWRGHQEEELNTL